MTQEGQLCQQLRHYRHLSCPSNKSLPSDFYRPQRTPETSFCQIVDSHYDEFKRVYPRRYREDSGYWIMALRSNRSTMIYHRAMSFYRTRKISESKRWADLRRKTSN
jgi:hypothetical protein